MKLPDSTLAWVEAAAGAPVAAIERLRGGRTSEMHALALANGGSCVLRRFVDPFFRAHADGLLRREAGVLCRLADGPIPVARLIALDPGARHADAPALLMSHLPGALALSDAGRIGELAALLVAIHRTPTPSEARPRPYQSWALPHKRVIPAWSAREDAWARLLALLDEPEPPHERCFLHRDFQPSNVLFGDDGRPTGVVDWVETSWGPPELDVAHCHNALAILHGRAVAATFPGTYEAAGGRLRSDRPYWEAMDLVGYLPDPALNVDSWREAGRTDLAPSLVAARLDERADEIVSGAG